jgi:hypothetical protein
MYDPRKQLRDSRERHPHAAEQAAILTNPRRAGNAGVVRTFAVKCSDTAAA